ncbi:hypothetical protein AB0M02_18895 [Actinoplanes sp. NPDC051861]|uniref:hypothetical protein n=1 Tax=Actinoplanes sp. NPDC051861 TaxID=3155170 RepID=UPI00343A4A02
MTDSQIDPRPAPPANPPEVPDVWFSSPPDEQALEERPRSAGVQIVFTSPPPGSR